MLLGLRESPGRHGRRHVTVLDLLSWAEDPGGDRVYSFAARQEANAWMARRGPLAPDSDAACVLYDFERGMKELSLMEQAVVALTVTGFSEAQIGALLGMRQQRVSRLLRGRTVYDAGTKEPVRDAEGDIARRGGIISKLTERMNGEGRS